MEMEKLASQNPWWADKDAIRKDSKVNRVVETGEKIVFALEGGSQVLIGPRQLGKTTALKYDIYRKIIAGVDPASLLYYSFDTSRSFEEISEVIDAFVVQGKKQHLYLDEVSFVDGWQRAVKRFLDSGRSESTTLYVTGSSSINLRKELMPGRAIRFMEFLPLSLRDFLMSFGSKALRASLGNRKAEKLEDAANAAKGMLAHFNEIEKLFGIYLHTGGYPDAIFDYLGNGAVGDGVYDTHWNAFVSDVSKDGKSVEIATAVVYGVLGGYSSKINLSGIARMQGIKSHVTVREYLESFEDLFVSKSIFPVSGKKYVFRKDRKVYLNDPFLYRMFARKTNLNDKDSDAKVAEGILFNHLHRFVNRGRTIAEPKTSVGFYSGKREVDFAVDDMGFELKWQNEVRIDDFPQTDLKGGVLLSKKTLDFGSSKAVVILPLSLFLSIL